MTHTPPQFGDPQLPGAAMSAAGGGVAELTHDAVEAARPVLVFDGACGFCRVWVDHWKRLTGERVEYVAFQEIGDRFPRIPREDFAAAVQLVLPEGEVRSGAHAVFTLFALARRKRWLLWVYERLPLASWVAEACYRVVARHRGLALRVTRLLWRLPPGP